MNFYVTFFIGTYYLALSVSRLLFLFIFSFVISYFPYFKLVTLKTLVTLCNTLKKEGRAFRNIGKKYIPILCNQPCKFSFIIQLKLLLIRSSTARGSGTSILLRWSLQKLTSKLNNWKDSGTKEDFIKVFGILHCVKCLTSPHGIQVWLRCYWLVSAALLLVSTKNSDLWEGPTTEVRNSRNSRHSAHAQDQV